MTKAIVAIIDDDQEVTDSLAWLIESIDYQVETYARVEPFLATLPDKQPNCLVLDIRMPAISGFELQQIFKLKGLKIPIIFITGYGEIPMAVQAIREGAVHFLTKPIDNQVLLETINKAVREDLQRREQEKATAQISARIKNLTPREHQVMCLMVQGKLTKTIAHQLNISISTVELHRAKVMKKMQMTSFAELVSLAAKHELITALPG